MDNPKLPPSLPAMSAKDLKKLRKAISKMSTITSFRDVFLKKIGRFRGSGNAPKFKNKRYGEDAPGIGDTTARKEYEELIELALFQKIYSLRDLTVDKRQSYINAFIKNQEKRDTVRDFILSNKFDYKDKLETLLEHIEQVTNNPMNMKLDESDSKSGGDAADNGGSESSILPSEIRKAAEDWDRKPTGDDDSDENIFPFANMDDSMADASDSEFDAKMTKAAKRVLGQHPMQPIKPPAPIPAAAPQPAAPIPAAQPAPQPAAPIPAAQPAAPMPAAQPAPQPAAPIPAAAPAVPLSPEEQAIADEEQAIRVTRGKLAIIETKIKHNLPLSADEQVFLIIESDKKKNEIIQKKYIEQATINADAERRAKALEYLEMVEPALFGTPDIVPIELAEHQLMNQRMYGPKPPSKNPLQNLEKTINRYFRIAPADVVNPAKARQTQIAVKKNTRFVEKRFQRVNNFDGSFRNAYNQNDGKFYNIHENQYY